MKWVLVVVFVVDDERTGMFSSRKLKHLWFVQRRNWISRKNGSKSWRRRTRLARLVTITIMRTMMIDMTRRLEQNSSLFSLSLFFLIQFIYTGALAEDRGSHSHTIAWFVFLESSFYFRRLLSGSNWTFLRSVPFSVYFYSLLACNQNHYIHTHI